jgi:hypothetical protein
MTDAATTTMASIPCCPDMTPDDACDVLDFLYRLNYAAWILHRGTPDIAKKQWEASRP